MKKTHWLRTTLITLVAALISVVPAAIAAAPMNSRRPIPVCRFILSPLRFT